MTIKVNGILGFAIYLALGLAVYMWLGTFDVFSWVNPDVYIYMFLWPFILFFKALFWVVIVVVVVIVGIFLYEAYDNYKIRRARRDIKTIRNYFRTKEKR